MTTKTTTVEAQAINMVSGIRKQVEKEICTAPTRLEILRSIFSEFKMATQTLGYSYDTTCHRSKAAGLIELLEVFDGGSVGGFDKDSYEPLYDRFRGLLVKYHKESDIDGLESGGFTVALLGEFLARQLKFRNDFFVEKRKK